MYDYNGGPFESFLHKNTRRRWVDSYLYQEIWKWVLDKNGSLQPRVGEDEEDEEDDFKLYLHLDNC